MVRDRPLGASWTAATRSGRPSPPQGPPHVGGEQRRRFEIADQERRFGEADKAAGEPAHRVGSVDHVARDQRTSRLVADLAQLDADTTNDNQILSA